MLKVWPGAHIFERTVHIETDLSLSLLGELKAVFNLILFATPLKVLYRFSN
jgi:hypothetical protein